MQLIVLYGAVNDKARSGKYQSMIDGRVTCGYRSYAEKFGSIVYFNGLKVTKEWEYSIPKPAGVLKFIAKHPKAVVWSVKNDPDKDREILRHVKNKKLYYSCTNVNMYNKYCDVSLVDTKQRVKGNGKVWFKGKDENFWKPVNKYDEFDYLLIGKRADKNELYFLKMLNKIKAPRRVLWVGGAKHAGKVSSVHKVVYTDFSGPESVRDNISRAKVGVLFTEHKREGFPQTFLEMTMCGVPVIYSDVGPSNKRYLGKHNCRIVHKKGLVVGAEKLLKDRDHDKCRQESIDRYSLSKSFNHMKRLLK